MNKEYYHKINNLDIAVEETNHKYIMINQWARDFSHKWGIAVFRYDDDNGFWYLQTFIDWAKNNGYEEKNIKDRRNVLSIERIDVNGNYEPNNCKWIPMKEQNKNKRWCGRKLGD